MVKNKFERRSNIIGEEFDLKKRRSKLILKKKSLEKLKPVDEKEILEYKYSGRNDILGQKTMFNF